VHPKFAVGFRDLRSHDCKSNGVRLKHHVAWKRKRGACSWGSEQNQVTATAETGLETQKVDFQMLLEERNEKRTRSLRDVCTSFHAAPPHMRISRYTRHTADTSALRKSIEGIRCR